MPAAPWALARPCAMQGLIRLGGPHLSLISKQGSDLMNGRSSLCRQPAILLSTQTGHPIHTTCLQDRPCGGLLLLRSRTLNRQHHGSGCPDRLIAAMKE